VKKKAKMLLLNNMRLLLSKIDVRADAAFSLWLSSAIDGVALDHNPGLDRRPRCAPSAGVTNFRQFAYCSTRQL
jgi:hypothetical protein